MVINTHEPFKIGIVGGGQLGKMLAISAKKMGFYVAVSDPTPNSPAGQVADIQVVGDYKDTATIKKLASLVDILTFEIELANDRALSDLLAKGKIIHPSPATLGIIRDKLLQKQFLTKNKIKTAEFENLPDISRIKELAGKFGYPFLLKARTDAYDGRGNALIKNEKDILTGLKKLEGRTLYVEKFVPFVRELAVIVARTPNGKIATYPVVETVHADNICDVVMAPAAISKKAKIAALTLARKTVNKLDGAGVFAIEMFLTKDDNVLVNEIAPRVHNSGHFTIEACFTSQFEQHIRAISDLPLGDTNMISKAAVMKNILGTKNGVGFPKGIEKVLAIPGVSLHMYGKTESRIARKMGHITVVGDTIAECLKKANRARRLLEI